jgi:hypothetical protein
MKFNKLTLNVLKGIAASSALVTQVSFAQIPVTDLVNKAELIVQQLNQLDQLDEMYQQTLQQLIDYKLQLQNLQKLAGPARANVQTNVKNQLANNVNDFGVSNLNGIPKMDSAAGTFYTKADALLVKQIGQTQGSESDVRNDMQSVGLDSSKANSMATDARINKEKYDRVLDDLRQVALTRKNSEERAKQANEITAKMAELEDNNTVGAIQLLAAQNSLAYLQTEDLIKNQAVILKNTQEQQARQTIEDNKVRQKELDRLKKLKQKN